MAVLIDPNHAKARGLLGQVVDAGRWGRPEAVAERVKADAVRSAALAEYEARRAKTPRTADGQWKLALWCEEIGLAPEAKAHLATVVRLDPTREAAWKRLGYKRVGGRWMTDTQIAALKAEVEA
jgi:hypothetical protein